MPLKRKAVVFGFSLAVSCTALTLLAVWSSSELTAGAVVVVALLWAVTSAVAGAAYYQEQSRKSSS